MGRKKTFDDLYPDGDESRMHGDHYLMRFHFYEPCEVCRKMTVWLTGNYWARVCSPACLSKLENRKELELRET